MKKLVGLKTNEILPGTKASRNTNESAGEGGEGEETEEGEEAEDDEDNASEVNDDEDDDFSFPDFTKDVTDGANKRLIAQAAYLVYKQQTVSVSFVDTKKKC